MVTLHDLRLLLGRERLESVCGAVLASLELYLLIRGTLGFGKEQSWEILHLGKNCPEELRTKFA